MTAENQNDLHELYEVTKKRIADEDDVYIYQEIAIKDLMHLYHRFRNEVFDQLIYYEDAAEIIGIPQWIFRECVNSLGFPRTLNIDLGYKGTSIYELVRCGNILRRIAHKHLDALLKGHKLEDLASEELNELRQHQL